MTLGKNRPLDPEELAFMDKLLDDEAERERQKKEYEDRGIEEYRTVRNLPISCPSANLPSCWNYCTNSKCLLPLKY